MAKQKKSKVRSTLHNIYFSKPAANEKKAPPPNKEKKGGFFSFGRKEKKPVQEKTELERPQFSPVEDKSIEKRLEQMQVYFEKRLSSVEQTISISRELFDELRRVNEALRQENKQLIDKLNTQSFDPNLQNWQEPDTYEAGGEEHQQKGNVKTQLDQLTDLIMEKGSIKIPDAAKKLKLKEKQVEEWAKMLEEHGMIEIHYPAIGKPVLKKKT